MMPNLPAPEFSIVLGAFAFMVARGARRVLDSSLARIEDQSDARPASRIASAGGSEDPPLRTLVLALQTDTWISGIARQ